MRYSQNNEEIIILNYFKGFKGTVLDIGANDGVTLSNSRALIERGWSGLMIEASPIAFRRLQKLYSDTNDVVAINCAVGLDDEEISFYESGKHLSGSDVGLLSTAKKDEIKRWNGSTTFTEITIPCLSFKSVMRLSKFNTFDFITIDIEGMELDVLPQISFERFGTKMVCVEWNGKNKERFIELMAGFNLVHTNGENLIFAK